MGSDPSMLVDLKRLCDVMESRYLLNLAAANQATDIKPTIDPYLTGKPDGPLGVFDADYMLSDLWDDICP